MRIIAFIQDSCEVREIIKALNIAPFKPPAPLATGPPPKSQLSELPPDDWYYS